MIPSSVTIMCDVSGTTYGGIYAFQETEPDLFCSYDYKQSPDDLAF